MLSDNIIFSFVLISNEKLQALYGVSGVQRIFVSSETLKVTHHIVRGNQLFEHCKKIMIYFLLQRNP